MGHLRKDMFLHLARFLGGASRMTEFTFATIWGGLPT